MEMVEFYLSIEIFPKFWVYFQTYININKHLRFFTNVIFKYSEWFGGRLVET